MDIQHFIEIIEDDDILLLPYVVNKPQVNRAIIPHFIPKLKEYQMGQIIYGSETPDIYTTLYLDGIVMLKHTENRYDDVFETGKFENFALFKGGKSANEVIHIKASKEVIILLKNGGVKMDVLPQTKNIIRVYLNSITFDSYKEIGGKYYFEMLCSMLRKEAEAKAVRKVLKHYMNKKYPVIVDKNSKLKTQYDINFVKILNENYITDKGYNPVFKSKSKKKEYEVKIKGLAHLPKIDDVLKRFRDGKKHTLASALMVDAVLNCESIDMDKKEMDKWIQTNDNEIIRITGKIRKYKYGMWLDGVWFYEFTERGNQEIIIDEWEYRLIYHGKED